MPVDTNAETIIDLFDGELAGIVLKRDIYQLLKLMSTLSIEEIRVQGFGFHGLSIVDLAVGWPHGLRCIALRWRWEVSRSFWLAHLLSEKESLWILSYRYPCMPMNSFVFSSAIQLLSRTGAMDHAKILVQAHIQKRKELADIGRQHLSAEDQENLGLTGKDAMPPDESAVDVYFSLCQPPKETIPWDRVAALSPGLPGLSVCAIICIHLMDICFIGGPPTFLTSLEQLDRTIFLVDVLDELWGNGFRAVNNGIRYTPLEGLLLALNNDLDRLPVVVWLLQHGANPEFFPLHPREKACCNADMPNNLLRGLGQVSAMVDYPLWAELLFDLVRYAAGVCDPVEKDYCVCYCSTDGCLPLHWYIMFDREWNDDCLGQEHEGNMMVSWIVASDLASDERTRCFEEVVRMELFFRLGLVHTCCRNWRITLEERIRFREEYEELGSQLNLLMTAYRGSLAAFLQQEEKEFSTEFNCACMKAKGYGPVTWGSHNLDRDTTRLLAHWRHWWKLVDQILVDPNTIPLEHSELYKIGDTRRRTADKMTALALEELGYGGMDYEEVIQRHFARELQHSVNDPKPSDQHEGREVVPRVRVERPELLDGLMNKLRRIASGVDEDDPARKYLTKKEKCGCQPQHVLVQNFYTCHHSWDYKTQTPRSNAQKKGDRPSVREPAPGYLMVEM